MSASNTSSASTTTRVSAPAATGERRSKVTDLDGNVLEAIVYIDDGIAPGRPRPGYLERVLTGAGEHSLPDDYLDYLRRWADAPRDPVRTTLTPDGPQTLAELLARPGVVETVELRSSFGFMAIHAGQLEEVTDRSPPTRRRWPAPRTTG